MNRVIVIGAGHSGLVSAIRLAEAGLDVTVLEHAQRPGGSVASAQATLPGFVHDTGAGFFPQTVASPAFAALSRVMDAIDWVNPPVPLAHPFLDGTAIALHRELESTLVSLDAAAPGSGVAWRRLMARVLPHRDVLVRTALSRLPPLRAGASAGLRLRRDGIELARRMLASGATFGRELFGAEKPAAWFAGPVIHSDLSPFAAGGGAFAFFLLLLGQAFGWPYPRGGAGRLSDALVGELERLGGQLRCACRVERIVSRRGRVDAVVGAGGEDLPCEAVVAAISASPLAAILPDDALPDRLLRRLRGWRYGLGAFKLDWALAGPVPWSSADTRRAGVVHLGDTLAALAAAAHEAGAGRVPAAPTLVVGQHSLHDPTRAPAGQHTLYAYTHLPQQPDLSDEQIADRVEQRIESFAPGFRELVLGRSCRSPRRLERENPSMVGGDLGGGSFELDQQFVFRPAPELCRYRTPLRGLYLAGSSTHPGAGVHGVSGDGAARALLADRSALRFWR
jgi:phytoene dehydrogenase-like protein